MFLSGIEEFQKCICIGLIGPTRDAHWAIKTVGKMLIWVGPWPQKLALRPWGQVQGQVRPTHSHPETNILPATLGSKFYSLTYQVYKVTNILQT